MNAKEALPEDKATKPISPTALLLELLPQSYWIHELWSLLKACLFWNGFPLEWDLDALVTPTNHRITSPKEERKTLGRVECVLEMYQAARDHIKKRTLHARYIKNEFYLTPYKFTKFCIAQGWMPVVKVFRELENAPRNIMVAILELFEDRRPTPAMATQIIKGNSKSIRTIHRKQCQSAAYKIYNNHLRQTGEKLTPTPIYKHKNYQTCLKRLRDSKDPEITMTYPRETHIRKWIPAGIKIKRARGRPRESDS